VNFGILHCPINTKSISDSHCTSFHETISPIQLVVYQCVGPAFDFHDLFYQFMHKQTVFFVQSHHLLRFAYPDSDTISVIMAYSLYDATIVPAKSALTSLKGIVTLAEKQPNSAALLTARLIEDMNPFSFQVYYAALSAEAVAAQLSSEEFKAPEEDLDSYAKMHRRIDQALERLDKPDRETVNKTGEAATFATTHEGRVETFVKSVVCKKHMPNIYFYVAMAYAILRKEGVPVGKRDWQRPFIADY